MRITDEVTKALEELGYKVEHISPPDDPGYSRATKGREFIDMQRYVELDVVNFDEMMEGLKNG